MFLQNHLARLYDFRFDLDDFSLLVVKTTFQRDEPNWLNSKYNTPITRKRREQYEPETQFLEDCKEINVTWSLEEIKSVKKWIHSKFIKIFYVVIDVDNIVLGILHNEYIIYCIQDMMLMISSLFKKVFLCTNKKTKHSSFH